MTFFSSFFVGVRLCVIAGDISPIDVITHVPVLCEESEIPYVYVPSKEVSLRDFVSSFAYIPLVSAFFFPGSQGLKGF